MSAALADILVLDVSGTISTTYCAKLFADYGATVVNLEPDDGLPTRKLPPHVDHAASTSAMHAYLNANKQSVLRSSLSDDSMTQLYAAADLVLNDGSDGRHCNTPLTMSITWYGKEGPYADFVGTDAQCFALNGMLRNIGHPEGPPLIPTGYQAQIVCGMTAFIGAMGQVLAHELSPDVPRQHLHTSIFESMLCFTDVGVVAAFNTGLEGHRLGINRFAPTYPLGVFPCRDGWIGLTVLTPSQWHAFCELLDMVEFRDVELFQSSVGRLEAVDVLEPVIRDKLLSHSAEELFYRAQHATIPLARVPTMEELFQVDQFVQRNAFAPVDMGNGQTLQAPTVPFRLFSTPPNLGGSVATLGADTHRYQT